MVNERVRTPSHVVVRVDSLIAEAALVNTNVGQRVAIQTKCAVPPGTYLPMGQPLELLFEQGGRVYRVKGAELRGFNSHDEGKVSIVTVGGDYDCGDREPAVLSA